jgi:DNA-binding NtrC family response regulator
MDDASSRESEARLTVPGAPSVTARVGTFGIEVVEGPEKGVSFCILPNVPSPVLVGKSSTCDLRITDGEVSRRHLSLDPTEKRLRISDLGSLNGTFVDGLAVEVAHLRGGELIRIGKTALRVTAQGASPVRLPIVRGFGSVLGTSEEMRRLYPLCERLAASNVPVIIEGETGTGKEVLAASLHATSPRAEGPFVVFDCTTVPPSLFESELFGHEKGAFTGAVDKHEGTFEQANGGTLFIDELGDLELALQAKLLRVAESGEVRRVGGKRPVPVDVRIICATRRNLDREVGAGRFRDDLFHRLAVGRIELPPLRRRKGDVEPLAKFFWSELRGPAGGPSPELLDKWLSLDWPGNVRELRNAVARAIALGELELDSSRAAPDGETHDAQDVAQGVAPATTPLRALIEETIARGDTLSDAKERLIQEFERGYLTRLIEKHGGDLNASARAAGIGRRYLNMIRSRSR